MRPMRADWKLHRSRSRHCLVPGLPYLQLHLSGATSRLISYTERRPTYSHHSLHCIYHIQRHHGSNVWRKHATGTTRLLLLTSSNHCVGSKTALFLSVGLFNPHKKTRPDCDEDMQTTVVLHLVSRAPTLPSSQATPDRHPDTTSTQDILQSFSGSVVKVQRIKARR